MAGNKWRRANIQLGMPTSNPVEMFIIRRENQYNKRLNDAKNKTNEGNGIFTIIGTEPNNRFRIYTWQIVNDWKWMMVSDVKTQKQWYFPKTYQLKNGWHISYYDNIDTMNKIHNRYNKKRWGITGRVRTWFFDNLYNEDGLTLWELTDRDILNK